MCVGVGGQELEGDMLWPVHPQYLQPQEDQEFTRRAAVSSSEDG